MGKKNPTLTGSEILWATLAGGGNKCERRRRDNITA